MSEMGHKQNCRLFGFMSALPPTTDVEWSALKSILSVTELMSD